MVKIKQLLDKIPNNIKTIVWNLFYLILLVTCNFLLENVANLGIPVEYVATVAILLSGLSKFLLTKQKK